VKGITHVRSLAFLAAAAAAVACRPKAPENPEPAVSAPAPSAMTLDEIANRIDPGAQTPLSDGLPPWMYALLGLEAKPSGSGEVLLEQSVAEQAQVKARAEAGFEDDSSMVFLIRAGARSVVLAEQAAQRGAPDADTLAQLERAYAAVDIPMLASDRSTFGQLLMMFAQAAASEGVGPSDAQQLQQLGGVVQGAIRAAGPLHRRTAAQLLRTAPEHQAVPTALLAVAKAERGKGQDWTIPAAKLALERRGTLASAEEQLDLARVCFSGLDVPCGEKALRAAAGAEGSDDVEAEAVLARRIVELADASTLDRRLERAHAMLKLERYAPAKAEFEALRSAFPQDARPVGGLARHLVETEFDVGGANRIIDAQTGLKNGDEQYYQLAIGTRAMAAMSSVLSSLAADDAPGTVGALEPLLGRMRADIDGYAALGNSDARYLGLLLDVGEELLSQYEKSGTVSLRGVALLGDRVVTLQSAVPTNPHAYRLLMSVALFEADKAHAERMVGVVAPAGSDHDVLVLRRARALADLAVTWSDASLAKQARDALRGVDAASSPEATELHADVLLVQRQLGGSAAWKTIGEAYEQLLDDNMTPQDARALNNVAMSLMDDDLSVAQQAWTLSAQLSEDHGDVGRLNLIVAGAPAGDAPAVAAMRSLAGETENDGVRVTALAWVHAWSKGKARRDAEAALNAALEDVKNEGARPTAPDPYSGLVLEGTLEAGLGYAVKTGLQIKLDGSGLPWAILAPPRR